MTIEEFDLLQTQTLETGQVLVEIETDVWVDYETYKPKPIEQKPLVEVVDNGE